MSGKGSKQRPLGDKGKKVFNSEYDRLFKNSTEVTRNLYGAKSKPKQSFVFDNKLGCLVRCD